MKVWVAVSGMYDSETVSGVYATAEAAMEAQPVREGAKPGRGGIGWKWVDYADGGWWGNGCDYDDHVTVEAYEVMNDDKPLPPRPVDGSTPPDHTLSTGERGVIEGAYNMDYEGWPTLIGGHDLSEFVDGSRGAEEAVYRVTIERIK